ncbi:MAG: ATP-binding cassette domain-containing protein [Pseudomonadota bacterium]
MSDAFAIEIAAKTHFDSDGRPVPVLRDLSMEMKVGAFTCIVGPSGCGKTTTMRILAGLEAEFTGTIDRRLSTARISYAFQEPRLLPWRTVAQNVALALGDAKPQSSLVSEALTDVGLVGLGERYPAQLSLGQARRVSLARAFAVEPDVLFLDEPFVSLDEAGAQRLRALLLDLWQRHGATVLMVTHNVREAVQLADQIVLFTERPAKVADVIDVKLPRTERDEVRISEFARKLAGRYPDLIAA